MPDTEVRKRSITIAGHRTSFTLEEAFWQQLRLIAQTEDISINRLVEKIDKTREGNLSSALRIFVLNRLLEQQNKQDSSA
ncbi:ribbon-helix-helix domain-containing protein [Kiloniella laminariae]|uniref:ribbon-helix-helix domain-containing protein n=1 Tax=Kiloniella laminariae TaxID=454162 RepID=UPI00035D7B93|nr:ribbon-helix-helix domain-containing protein [Kiloniella laminariae]